MNIVFVGVFKTHSTNIAQAEAFEKLGHNVTRIDYRRNLEEFNGSVECRDQYLVNLICKSESFPDIVLFSKCNNMSYLVLSEIRYNTTSKIVLWYQDPIHNFDKELIEKIRFSDYVFCALHDPYKESLKYSKNSYFLPEGWDEKRIYPVMEDYAYGVSFIGSLYGNRQEYFDKVGFTHLQGLYDEDHNIAVAKSKINLNFTQGGSSDRVYKVLAAKGFLLTESWPNMDDLFTPGKDFVVFDGVDDLKKKIEYYLQNEKERLEIAEHGYKTVQKYTVTNWARKIVETVIN